MAVVQSQVKTPAGTPAVGVKVAAYLAAPSLWLADGSAQIVSPSQTVTDSSGAWSLDLTPQSQLEATDSHYRIRVGYSEDYYVVVPDAGPVDLHDIRVDPATLHPVAPAEAPLYLTQAAADARYSRSGGSLAVADVSGLQAALDGKQAAGSYITSDVFTDTITDMGNQVSESIAGKQDVVTKSQSNAAWRSAFANRWYAKCNIVCLGASETEGFNGPTDFYQSWTPMLAKLLQGSKPGGVGFIHPVPYFTPPAWWPCVATGNNAASPAFQFGPNHQARMLATGTTPGTLTYTVKGTSVDVMYIKTPASSGVMSVQIDGGTATTINTAGATANTEGVMQRFSLGASGTHTVVVKWSSGQPVYVDGVVVYDGDETTGVTVHRLGANGWSTYQWINYPAPPDWAKAVAAMKPNLAIITQGVNDMKQGRTVAQFKADLLTMMSQLRAANATGVTIPILLNAYTAPSGYESQWPPYVAAMKELADSDPLTMFYDQSARIPPGSDTLYGLYTDGAHFTAKGASWMADNIAQFINR